MSTISTILSTLRSAVWAIDVRDEIADAIEQCYKDVNSPSLVTDGIEEVIGDMVDNGRISGAIVEDLGLITEGTSNLFDFTTVTAGRLNTSTGEVGEASGYWTSDYIAVESGKTYYFANTDRRVAYNSSKVYSANISGTTWTASADGYIRVSVTSANRKTAKINEGSAKDYRPGRSPIDFNLRDDVYRKAEVDAALAAVTIATDPELETAGAAADAKATGDAISALNESLGDFQDTLCDKVESVNLVDSSKITTGYLGQSCVLNTNNGRITEFIKVKPSTEYTANYLGFGTTSSWVSWMFESDSLASKIDKVPSETFTTPANCNYVRLVYTSQSNADSAMLVEGDTLPASFLPYQEAYYTLKNKSLEKILDIVDNNFFDATFGKCSANSETHVITKVSTGLLWGSGFFRVYPYVTYWTNRTWSLPHSFVYDKDMNFICTVGNSDDCITHQDVRAAERIFTITNPDAYYCILCGTGDTYPDGVVIKTMPNGTKLVDFDSSVASGIKSRMSSVSPYMYGKKWAALGDSITQGDGLEVGITSRYSALVANQCGVTAYNYGVSGSRISAQGSVGDGTYDNAMVIRYASMIDDADYITVLGGINDANNTLPLGTLGSTDISTFYGALEVLITGLLTRYPGKGIGFITYPHYDVSERHQTYVNAIKEACARYAIPVLDLYNTGMLNRMTSEFSTMFYSDGLHPNELGHSVIARKVCAFLGTL